MSEESMFGCCQECGEFDCDIEHDNDVDDDDSWFFDGSGMINDD